MREPINANEGKILTDGVTYASTLYVGEGVDPNSFYEITEEEYREIEESGVATDEDYQNALRDMGVSV